MESIKWVLTLLVAVVALVISAFSLRQSRIGNDIARTAEAHNATQDARELVAEVEVKHYIARSPDLRADEDRSWLDPIELSPSPIPTDYWLAEYREYSSESREGYLFIVVINHGPGRIKEMRISSIDWIPKRGSQAPVGIDVDGAPGILLPGHFYALLIDVLEPPSRSEPWKRASFDLASVHFERLGLEITYVDELGVTNQRMIGMGEALPAGTPTPPLLDIVP